MGKINLFTTEENSVVYVNTSTIKFYKHVYLYSQILRSCKLLFKHMYHKYGLVSMHAITVANVK